jgi:hypothetical protein
MLGALNTILKKIIGDKKEKPFNRFLKPPNLPTNQFQVLVLTMFVECHLICRLVFKSMFNI